MMDTEAPATPGSLFVVSTPIGNLGDISLRAIEVLRSAHVILAEDTRHSRTLTDRYEIATPMHAYHEHNEARETPRLVERLLAGERMALISDAGTPLLSDPGARLVRAAADAGVAIVPVPGASALLAALVASALDATRFTFVGSRRERGRDRRRAAGALSASPWTSVLYEAPSRVADTLMIWRSMPERARGGGRRELTSSSRASSRNGGRAPRVLPRVPAERRGRDLAGRPYGRGSGRGDMARARTSPA